MERELDGLEATRPITSDPDQPTDLALARTDLPLAVDAVGGLAAVRSSARAKLFGGAPPTLTIGRYAVVRRLGAGGMGAVYEAFDPQLERRAAVKVILGQERPELVQRLVREARAMARLSHPNIAHVYEVGELEGQTFIAMELIDGVTLRHWVADEARRWGDVVAMYIGAGRGLAAAHRAGIVHRDFKPDNVMVDREGRPRVLDFGLAHAERAVESLAVAAGAPADLRTRAGAIMGTPAYMAPEQFAGARSDARTDQFAFAVSLFEALTGQRPFAGNTFEELAANVGRGEVVLDERAKQVPRAVMAALRVALRPVAETRHASMDALLAQLERALHRPRRTGLVVGFGAALAIASGVWIARPDEDAPPIVPDDPPPSWLATSNLPEPLPVPHREDRFGVTIHRLSNGLTVYIAPRHDLPRVQVRTVVRAGFADEPIANGGIATLVATVLQHGSEELGTLDAVRERSLLAREAELFHAYAEADPTRRAELADELRALAEQATAWSRPDEIEAIYHELGIESDFEVTADATVFRADVPSNRVDAWAQIEAEKLVRPAFRSFAWAVAKTLERARAHEPELADAARAAVFAGTSRSGTAFGSETSLSSLPLGEVQRFHDRWYRPNNTAIVLVGDIDPGRIVPVLERAFGGWAPRDLPETAPLRLRVPKEPIVVEGRAAETLTVAWPRGPGWLPSELEILFEGLLRAENNDTFFTADKVVYSDLLVLEAAAEEATMSIAPEIAAVVDDLSHHPVDDETLASMWNGVLHAVSLDLEAAERAAERIAAVYANGLRWEDDVEYLFTGPPEPDGLVLAVRELFASPIVVHGVRGQREPLASRPSALAWVSAPVEPTSATARSARALAILQVPASPIEPKFLVRGRDYRLHDSPSGVVVTARCQDRVWLEQTYALQPDEAMACVELAGALGQLLADSLGDTAVGQGAMEVSVNCSFNGRVNRLSVTSSGVAMDDYEAWLDPAAWIESVATEPGPRTIDRSEIAGFMRRMWAAQLEADAEIVHMASLYGDRSSVIDSFWSGPTAVATDEMLLAVLRRRHSTAYCGPEGERVEQALGVDRGELPTPPSSSVVKPPMTDKLYVGVNRPGASRFDALLRYEVTSRSNALALVVEEYLAGPRLGLLTAAAPGVEVEVGVGGGEARIRLTGPTHLGPSILPAIERALQAGADRERFESAKAVVEERLRAGWLVGPAIAEAVLDWYDDGHLVDPRAETWRDLATLRFEDLQALLIEVAQDPNQLSIVGNRRVLQGEGRWSGVQWR